jgi:hypothetical protein
MAEAKLLHIEGSRLIDRVYRNHWHQLSVLVHPHSSFLVYETTGWRVRETQFAFNYFME